MKVIFAVLTSSFLVSLYAIIQHFGFDPLSWAESSRVRAFSSLGQPNHLGSFLLMTIPVCAYLLYASKKNLKRFFLGLILLANFLALYFSLSSASWLALGIAAVITIVLNFIISKKLNKKVVFHIIASVFLIFLIGIIIIQNKNVQAKLSNFSDIKTGSTAARLDIWQASWKAVKDRPWFGYGLDTQGEVILKNYEPDWAIHSNVNVQPSRAHNIFLDVLLSAGVMGLVIFLVLLFFIAKLIWNNLQKAENRAMTFAISYTLIAYFIYLQFNYTHITNQIYFILYLAILFTLGKSKEAEIDNEKGHNTYLILICKYFVLVLFSFLATYQINQHINFLKADHYFLELRQAEFNNQYVLALDLYDYIKKEIPGYSVYDQKFVAIMDNWGKRFDNDLFYKIVNECFIAVLPEIKGDSFSDKLARARIHSSLGKSLGEDYPEKARIEYHALIAYSSNIPFLHRELAEHYSRYNEYEKALAEYNEALSEIPALDSHSLNLDHKRAIINEMGRNYEGMKKAYEGKGDKERAEEMNVKIEELSLEE